MLKRPTHLENQDIDLHIVSQIDSPIYRIDLVAPVQLKKSDSTSYKTGAAHDRCSLMICQRHPNTPGLDYTHAVSQRNHGESCTVGESTNLVS